MVTALPEEMAISAVTAAEPAAEPHLATTKGDGAIPRTEIEPVGVRRCRDSKDLVNIVDI